MSLLREDEAVLAIGLMSGTSMDGVDAAIIATDGDAIQGFGPATMTPYSPAERQLISHAIKAAASISTRESRSGVLAEAENMLTRKHGEAVLALMKEHKLEKETIAVVGFHGQTVLHRPEASLTVQLGDGQALADMTGLPVVYDFRASDMAAGGQGAPFVPIYHRALATASSMPLPIAFVNIGGVANVTWIGENGELLAFDAGPGNALIDDWAQKHLGEPIDRDGKLAGAGQANTAVLEKLLRHPFFDIPPPKSLDRNNFSADVVSRLGAADGAATLTAFTAGALSRAAIHFPSPVKGWVLAGGGARNPTMVETIRRVLPERVILADEAGWPGDFVEAQAFAYLAVRSLKRLPLSFPGTTGVKKPLTGGKLANPRNNA